MVAFTKKSLEVLKKKVDLTEVFSHFFKVREDTKTFAVFRCPFHPRNAIHKIIVNKKTNHYICCRCESKEDAIDFLMFYKKMTCVQALKWLAKKFNVNLEKMAPKKEKPKEIKKRKTR